MTNRWTILALLFLVRSCMGFQFQSVPAVSPLFLKTFAVGMADIGLLIGLYHAPGIALALPSGRLGQRFKDTAIVAGGLALMLVGTLLMALSETWPMQIAGRLLAGTGAVGLNVFMSKMVTDWFAGKELATAMGIFVNSWPFGIAVGLVAYPMIVANGGLLAVHATVALALAAAFIALVVLYQPPLQVAATKAVAGGPPRGTARVAVLTAGLAWGFYNAALGVVFGFGPLMLTERGWTLADASSMTSVVLWLAVISVPLGGVIADHSGRHMTVLIGSCIAFAAALLAATRSDATLLTFCALGLVGGLAAGPIMSLPSRVLEPKTRAIGMGLFFTMFYVMQAAGPWIAGRASAATGTAATAFDFGAMFLLVTMSLAGLFLHLAARTALIAPRSVGA